MGNEFVKLNLNFYIKNSASNKEHALVINFMVENEELTGSVRYRLC